MFLFIFIKLGCTVFELVLFFFPFVFVDDGIDFCCEERVGTAALGLVAFVECAMWLLGRAKWSDNLESVSALSNSFSLSSSVCLC